MEGPLEIAPGVYGLGYELHSDSDHTGLAPTLRELGAKVLIDADDEPTLAKPGPKGGDASPIHMLPLFVRSSAGTSATDRYHSGDLQLRRARNAGSAAHGRRLVRHD